MRCMSACRRLLSERKVPDKTESYIECQKEKCYRAMSRDKQRVSKAIKAIDWKVAEVHGKIEKSQSMVMAQMDASEQERVKDIQYIGAKVIAIESHLNVPKKARRNYGAVCLALLVNFIRVPAKYDLSLLIGFSDSRRNMEKINKLAIEINCQPKNIKTELNKFKSLISLLSQPRTTLKKYLTYIEQIRESAEYNTNGLF